MIDNVGKTRAEESAAHNRSATAIRMVAAQYAITTALVGLLITKGVLKDQDVLAQASDDIQRAPESAVGVQLVEGLCGCVTRLGGATRSAS
jgi:hypothetical protein